MEGKSKQASIKNKLMLNFVFVISITVIILEIFLVSTIRVSYYKNLESNLTSQTKLASQLYEKYFSSYSLYENILNNVDTYWKQAQGQVQILDTAGNVIMDSIGVIHDEPITTLDVKKALEGSSGYWIGRTTYDVDDVIAVAYPLKSSGNIEGVIRIIASLRDVNKSIMNLAAIFMIIGIVVIACSVLVSMLISRSILIPLNAITSAAEKMAGGDMKIRTQKVNDDELGKLSDTLNYMADEIERKEELKNNFISSVSHELRTPLTSIKGWAVTLKDTPAEDAYMVKEGLDIIEKESDRLTEMVETLLDFSRFVSAKVVLKKETVNIKQLMEGIRVQMLPRAKRDGIDFRVEFKGSIENIESDENRLKQVFINIIDNAFSFTPIGGRIVFEEEEAENKLIFRISDNGCGISEEDLLMVKEKFYKGKTSKSKHGIGLSICDEIVKLMNGELNIKSKQWEGTIVEVILPLEEEK